MCDAYLLPLLGDGMLVVAWHVRGVPVCVRDACVVRDCLQLAVKDSEEGFVFIFESEAN